MRVIIVDDYSAMSKKAASIMAKIVRVKPDAVLGLATGSTPLGAYQELVRMHKEEGLDFSRVRTFNLDEYYRVPADHPQSYHRFMSENFFSLVNIDPSNVSVPDGMAKDVERYCEDYEKSIRDAGGIDLQLLGIGRDGHIGFNEPGSSLGSRTRIKTLSKDTVRDNARFFGGEAEVPGFAITMGVGTILGARRLLMLASGENKAAAIRGAIEGPVTASMTASALQLHPNVTVVIDGPAAELLREREYYDHVEKMAEALEVESGT